jgi:hypothetical protein
MTNHVEIALRTAIVGMFCLPVIASGVRAVAAPTEHAADPTRPADVALLQASGDTVSGGVIRNTCGGIVRPAISLPARDMAVVIESDPTGQCVGSNPPSSLTILLRHGRAWRNEAGFPASGYRLGHVHAGRPDIIAQYPPFDRDCPVATWDGAHYRFSRDCDDGRGR